MSNRNLWIFLALAGGLLLLQSLAGTWQGATEVPYSDFLRYLREGRIESVLVTPDRVEATLKGAGDEPGQQIAANRVDGELVALLQAQGVAFRGESGTSGLGGVMSWLLPPLLILGIWWFAIRRFMGQGGGGGLLSVGKSRARIYAESDIKVTFDDVAGVDEAKEELQEIVNFLRDPQAYGRLGGRMPRGILLVGPPGTGKTLLARAVAGEAGVPFFSISGSEFVELFVGVGAARVRDLFEQARAKAPAIIFIDELDALGRARGAYPLGGGHDEKEQTLNQLLAELDGFDTTKGVVLLGATNRPEILDPALLRAGRFDRQVLVDRPDRLGRVQILQVHLRKAKLAPSVEPAAIAALTPGFTGADLANLVNEATLLATRRSAGAVEMEDFTQAIERIVAGLEKRNRILNPLERKVIAYHEMGHALVALALPGSDRVHKVSIIPRGVGALGYTIQRPTEDRFLMTREELEGKMTVLLGGRAAESIAFQSFSTGAADDLAKATDIARSMVVRYGMDPVLGQVAYESEPQALLPVPGAAFAPPRRYSEETAQAIDKALHRLVDEAFDRARQLLQEQRARLEAGVGELLEKETLDEAALLALLQRTPVPSPAGN